MYRDKTRYGQDPTQVIRSKDATFHAPLAWERQAVKTGKPRRVFTCSWSDFFIAEADDWRDEALVIMALTPHLTYQVLTKRPDRMLASLSPWNASETPADHLRVMYWRDRLATKAYRMFGEKAECAVANAISDCLAEGFNVGWPFRHVWMGVSVENQATADQRIPLLLQTPAAKHFISYEPALEPVNFDYFLGDLPEDEDGAPYQETISWIIIGGESGPDARPFDLTWARSTIAQCRAAGTPCLVKQLGAFPVQPYEVGSAKGEGYRILKFRNRAGADPEEWPADLQVQLFPSLTA